MGKSSCPQREGAPDDVTWAGGSSRPTARGNGKARAAAKQATSPATGKAAAGDQHRVRERRAGNRHDDLAVWLAWVTSATCVPGWQRRQCDDGSQEPGEQADGGCRGAAAGPGPRAGPDGYPDQAGAGDRRPGPGHVHGAEPVGGRRRSRGQPGLPAPAAGEGDPRDDPRHDGQRGSGQRSHRAAAPGPGLSGP